MRESFLVPLRTACEVGFLLRLVAWHALGFAAGCTGDLTAGMTKCRAGKDGLPTARFGGAGHPGLLAPRSASGLGAGCGGGRACPDSVQPSW